MVEQSHLFPPSHDEAAARVGGGKALRAFAWYDLAARINAARELRDVLRHDIRLGSSSFTDAAAGYFAPDAGPGAGPNAGMERPVNHNTLSHRKSCGGNNGNPQGEMQENGREKE